MKIRLIPTAFESISRSIRDTRWTSDKTADWLSTTQVWRLESADADSYGRHVGDAVVVITGRSGAVQPYVIIGFDYNTTPLVIACAGIAAALRRCGYNDYEVA